MEQERDGGGGGAVEGVTVVTRALVASALTPEGYARYGAVIMASAGGETGSEANQGSARRFDRLAEVVDLRPGRASANVALFRCSPRLELPFVVALLEKHPSSTQLFFPMNARRYLVVVARGNDRPDLSTLSAFVASGRQGISYFPGVWHHPLIALDAETDFACLVFEDGSAGDCEVFRLPIEDRVAVTIGAGEGQAS
jgi:ureidoglycolate lyase